MAKNHWSPLLPHPSPNIKPMSQAKNVGRNPKKSEEILGNFSVAEGIRSSFITVEDKDPSVLWVCLDDPLVRHWVFKFLLAPSRWEVLALDPESVLTGYRNILNRKTSAVLAPP